MYNKAYILTKHFLLPYTKLISENKVLPSGCCSLLLSCVWLFVTPWLQHTRLPVLHYLPEFAETHVHWVSDAIQSSHPLPPPSPPALNLLSIKCFSMSWLSLSGGQSIGVSVSALPMNILGWFPLGLTGLTTLLSKGLSGVLSSTTVWRHRFFGTPPSLPSSAPSRTWPPGWP